MLRKLITASQQIVSLASRKKTTPMDIDKAEQMIFRIAEDRVRQGFQYIGDGAHRRLEQIEQMAAARK